MADETYHFLSHVRVGFAGSIVAPDTFGSAQPALATAPVGVTVSGVAQPVTHRAVVRGPGDVIGVSASQVVRTDPIDGSVGVEPNYFAQIEFDRPDLPWIFTPAAAVGERLRPWIVLVVLDAEGPGACVIRPGSLLPVVSVSATAASALPDLGDSHLWAHAQAILPAGMTLAAALADGADPRLTISRLLCPRHLAPNRWYVAAVVPAFNVGRLAGLSQSVTEADEAKLDPSWQAGAAVDLPVYHSWHFRTGEDADFEALAGKLKGRPLPAGVGARTLDVSRPGAGLPAFPTPVDASDTQAITWLDGALQPVDAAALPARDPAAAGAFATSLTILLDRPADLVIAGDGDPVVAPPIYGGKHALVVRLDGAAVPPWIRDLNLEPRARVAAGLGTQVVQARQEDYVARAWRQLGDVLAANRLLRAAQFARSGSLSLHRRLAALDSASLMSLTFPAHQRVAGIVANEGTLTRAVADSRLPNATVEPAFRRIMRGSIAFGQAAAAPAVVARFATEQFTAATGGPDGSTAMRPATQVIGTARSVAVLMALGDDQPQVSTRFDTMLSTLATSAQALPTGDALRALPLRTDAGAVGMMTGLGAVSASSISAVLNAATMAQPVVNTPLHAQPATIAASHALLSTQLRHLPGGLTQAATSATTRISSGATRIDTTLVFESGGASKQIGVGSALKGGNIVVDTDTVRQIALKQLVADKLDDTRWANLEQSATIPIANRGADAITDAGTRLDVFRREPTALAALAEVANGNPAAAVVLDSQTASLATSGTAKATIAGLAIGNFTGVLPTATGASTGASDLAAGHELVLAAATAIDRMVGIGDAPPSAAAPSFDLAAARTGLLARLDPGVTVPARIQSRLVIGVRAGVPRRDVLDPIMASPQFNDPMWRAVNGLGAEWLLPGLDKVLPDTATLVKTNPSFVAAHMVGLNHEMMRELLWREYPTDQRGTPFHRFWGRLGAQPDDIGPVNGFTGELTANLLAGQGGEAVLLLRTELLRRYPGSIVYLCRATAAADGGPQLDDSTIVLPSFRGDLPPDVSFAGFPVTPDALRDPHDPFWFVIAQPPSEPRFGLDNPSADTPARPILANDLAWSHMSADGNPDSPSPFATSHAPVLQSGLINGVRWGDSAAIQAELTYQHPVRVAIRALDLLPPLIPGGPQ